MMRVEATEEVSVRRWEHMVQSSPAGHFFYTHEWATILRETYGYRAAPVLFEVDGIDILVPMMEITRFPFSFLESMPLGYGGLLSAETLSSAEIQGVIKKIVRGRRLNLYMNFSPIDETLPREDLQIHKMQTEWDYTHMLPLNSNYERVAEQYHKGPRRRIRSAETSDLTIRLTNDLKDYRSFYDLYTRRSEEWGYRKPPHPWDLYRNLQHHGGDHVRLRIAEMNGVPIGGAITFEYGTNAFQWIMISPMEYLHLGSTYLMLRDIIQSLCERGFTHFNLGGSGKLDGVRKFKESFGGVRVPLCRYEACSLLGKIILRR